MLPSDQLATAEVAIKAHDDEIKRKYNERKAAENLKAAQGKLKLFSY